MTTFVITGSRKWTDREAIRKELAFRCKKGDRIIHGAAEGADAIANQVGEDLELTVIAVPAQWDKYGPSAGPRRNRVMLDMKPDVVIAFPLPGSIGTWDCVNEAMRRGITVVICDGK